MIKAALKFVAQNLAGGVLANAGAQIGEAIGKRIGDHIYTAPEQDDDKPPPKKRPRRSR